MFASSALVYNRARGFAEQGKRRGLVAEEKVRADGRAACDVCFACGACRHPPASRAALSRCTAAGRRGGWRPGERFPRRARCAGFFCGGAL